MSEKTYADEATLTAHLDKLLSTATTPTQAESVYTDTVITSDNLLSGQLLANDTLSTLGIAPLPPLPTKPETKPCEDLLAAAFTAIVKLSRCALANKNLREGAEAQVRASTKRVEELTARFGAAETRVRKKDMLIASMQNASDDLVSRHRVQVKKLSAECAQLRSRLLHASHRENQLVMSAKKKEKEFGQLQSRVHALFKTSVPIEQRITRVGTRASPKGQDSMEADVTELGEERVTAVEGENDVMRGLLQAVQEELDDLILSTGRDSGSVVSEEFDVPPAPGDEVMQMPMDVIGDDLQDSLERKFAILRKALEHGGGVEELEPEDNDDLVEECGEMKDNTLRYSEQTVSPNPAHRSVDAMSTEVGTYVGENAVHQTTQPEANVPLAEAEEVGNAAQNADTQHIVDDTETSVPTDAEPSSQPTERDFSNSSQLDTEILPVDVGSLSDVNAAGTQNDAKTGATENNAGGIQETLDALNTLTLTEQTDAPLPPVPTTSNPSPQ